MKHEILSDVNFLL